MKGQTATEFMLLAALIMVVASIVYVSYSEESADTIAETTMRTQIDFTLAKAAFTNASCATAKLNYFNGTKSGEYTLYIYPTDCGPSLFGEDTREDISGRVSEALGCRYDDYGKCKGKTYKLVLP